MAKKIRELKAMLRKAGFQSRPGKGNHSVWYHPQHPGVAVAVSGNDGRDAKPYLERRVQEVIAQVGGQVMDLHYSVVVQWSDEDRAYLVTLPEFGAHPQTHGDTYEEAFTNAREVLELLVETYQAEGWPLPAPAKYAQKASA